jgi:hypothetical protein
MSQSVYVIHAVKIETDNENVVITIYTNLQRTKCFKDTFPIRQHERLAEYIEDVAADYDGETIPIFGEPSRCLDGPAAYKLWARRLKRATGITLRKPRLSRVCGGLPKDLIGIYPNNPFGKRIIPLHVPEISTLKDLACSRREDALVIVEAKRGVLSHGSLDVCHDLVPVETLYSDCSMEIPTTPVFFSREKAELMLARLRKHLPEYEWQAITLAQLAAQLVGHLLAA